MIVSLSHSTVFWITLLIRSKSLSLLNNSLISFFNFFIPPPKQPITNGITFTLYPFRLSRSSKHNCWYFLFFFFFFFFFFLIFFFFFFFFVFLVVQSTTVDTFSSSSSSFSCCCCCCCCCVDKCNRLLVLTSVIDWVTVCIDPDVSSFSILAKLSQVWNLDPLSYFFPLCTAVWCRRLSTTFVVWFESRCWWDWNICVTFVWHLSFLRSSLSCPSFWVW